MGELKEYKREMYAQCLADGQPQHTAELNAGLTRHEISEELGDWRFEAALWNRVKEIRAERGGGPLKNPELEKQANDLLVAMRGEEIMQALTEGK